MPACVSHLDCGFASVRFCFLFPPSYSTSPLQMMSLITRAWPPSLCHIFLLSHSQTRHSVKAFKVTYIQPLLFLSHSCGGGGCILIWFFPSDSNTEPVLVDTFGGDSTAYQRNYAAECEVWRLSPMFVFALSTIWTEEGTRLQVHNASLSAPPPAQTHMYPHRRFIARQVQREPPEALQRQRDVCYLTVCLRARPPLLLTSETLSHHWPCDLTLSKYFTQAAVHCWALKASSHKHQGSFPLNGGGLRAHRYKHLWKDNDLSQVTKFINSH